MIACASSAPPFDHPELCVPIGHAGASSHAPEAQDSDRRFELRAADKWDAIPAVRRKGNAVPLQTFDELLAGIGVDGSRAHPLAEACAVPLQ